MKMRHLDDMYMYMLYMYMYMLYVVVVIVERTDAHGPRAPLTRQGTPRWAGVLYVDGHARGPGAWRPILSPRGRTRTLALGTY